MYVIAQPTEAALSTGRSRGCLVVWERHACAQPALVCLLFFHLTRIITARCSEADVVAIWQTLSSASLITSSHLSISPLRHLLAAWRALLSLCLSLSPSTALSLLCGAWTGCLWQAMGLMRVCAGNHDSVGTILLCFSLYWWEFIG